MRRRKKNATHTHTHTIYTIITRKGDNASLHSPPPLLPVLFSFLANFVSSMLSFSFCFIVRFFIIRIPRAGFRCSGRIPRRPAPGYNIPRRRSSRDRHVVRASLPPSPFCVWKEKPPLGTWFRKDSPNFLDMYVFSFTCERLKLRDERVISREEKVVSE